MLHVAISRYIDDQDNYGVYKEVLKYILSFGASRELKNQQGMTAEKLILSYQPRVIL